MSYALLSDTTPVAQKQHRCIWCGQAILPGEKYRRTRSVYDGSLQDQKWHLECADAQQAEAAEVPEWGGEFMPYKNERPAIAGVPGTFNAHQEKRHG